MYVVTRSGHKESVRFDKITDRIQSLCFGLDMDYIDPIKVSQKVIESIYDGISTESLDQLAAETAAYMATYHPHYMVLAGRIAVSNLHKMTDDSFVETIDKMYHHINPRNHLASPLVSKELYEVVKKNRKAIEARIRPERDYNYDYFGFKTLEKSYLLKLGGQIVERPGYMLMRVSLGIHGEDLESAFETYDLMSEMWFTHASPTLFNAGTNKPQLSSCFLLTMQEDSIEGIYKTLKDCALISQGAGGIGVSIHNVRSKGSFIRGTNGTSNGIVPMLRVFNDTARYVDQGGGKRKGSFAIYLEPWHADIMDFLELKLNHGKEEVRARDLFYALWIPDLFMKKVKEDGEWHLFCPHEAPGLHDCWGAEFEALYETYVQEGRARQTVRAQEVWFKILKSHVETGMPFMLFKDAANGKSNQQNLGTIKSSNLCTEIIEYTAPDEVAVCNLASIALPRFVKTNEKGSSSFDYQKLYEVVYRVTRNLNRVIDINFYPVPEAENSNFRHRPIGIGVQGLQDAFFKMRMPFESHDAKLLNVEIFETIYFAAMTASCDLAEKEGAYETFSGSPASKGQFQFDLWGTTPTNRWDWDALKERVKKHGLRNSLLVAPMPTASTSQILGNTESIEPLTSNIYIRRVLSGEFAVVNKYLVEDLVRRQLWSPDLKDEMIAANGSIQHIDGIPEDLKALYKTVWEIKQRAVVDMAADRAPYICQSQSLNIHMEGANFGKLTSLHFYAWEKGLKTGMYYLRTRPAASAIKFTLSKGSNRSQPEPASEAEQKGAIACSLENPEDCISCGS